jgi:SPP1 gp7 family putative phage head morphogenesis protein
MIANPHDKPILSDRTQLATRLKIEQRFTRFLPRELLAATKNADPKAIKNIIKKTAAANIWGLWLSGMNHGRDHAHRELKMTGRGLLKLGNREKGIGNRYGSTRSNPFTERLERVRGASRREARHQGGRVRTNEFSLLPITHYLLPTPRLANFALLDDQSPPSKMQNKRAQDAIWTRVNTLAGNVADTEWARIQAALVDNVDGEISRSQLQAAITDTLGGERFKGRSESIARTELTFAYNAGRVETYRDNNVEAIRRYCISDERTCEQCAGLNGMIARLDDMAACMRIFAPSHVRCRCTTGVVLDVRQLAEANRQPPPLAKEPWMMGSIVAAIIS